MRFEDDYGFEWVLDLHFIMEHMEEYPGENLYVLENISQYDPDTGECTDAVFMQQMRREHPWPQQPETKRWPWIIAHSIHPALALAEELDRCG